MLPALTARQKEIYDFLLRTIRENGYARSIHEIGARLRSRRRRGDAEAVLQNGEVITLKAENKNYAPIIVSEGEFCIVGRVVGLMRKF